MQLHCPSANLAAIRNFASPARCPHCGDWMVAPVMSEFVETRRDPPPLGMRRLRGKLLHLDPATVE